MDKHPHLLANAQLHDEMIFRSDHKMVVTTLDLSLMHKLKSTMNRKNIKDSKEKAMNYDTKILLRDEVTRT
jgi:hypothetical protein